MRWWFTALMAGAVLATPKFLGIHLPTAPLLSIVAALAAWNLVSHWWTRHRTVGLLAVALAIWVDLAALAGLLYFSGGATNPLVSMLILPVVAGLLSLTPAQALCIAAGSVLSYSWLMTQFVALHVHDETNASHLHLYGMWVTFVVSIATVTWLVLRLSQALRERAAELDAIRERALRDERIVTIGTLAAGAAHELGTPLSTMAVVVDDLRSAQGHSEDVQADLAMLDEQIAECKRIVGRLTEKADVSRSAGAQRVLAGEWLSALTGQWQTARQRPANTLVLAKGGDQATIVSEAAVDQAMMNLLDNAWRAGPPVHVGWALDSGFMRISITDQGTGFAFDDPDLAGFEPITHSAEGQGYGLMLARAAVERVGGRLKLGNAPGGKGALVEVWLPLVEEPPHG